jgi:microcystin-dependent protein
MGQGQGLTARTLGEMVGSEAVGLTVTTMPAHQHVVHACSTAGKNASPKSNWWAASSTGDKQYAASANAALAASAIGVTGGALPHENMMPFQAVTFIICFNGIYPSQG